MRRRARRRNDGAGDEEQWLPFGIEDHEVAAFNILWERVPSWFEISLWQWIARNLVGRDSRNVPVIEVRGAPDPAGALEHQVSARVGLLQLNGHADAGEAGADDGDPKVL